MRFNVRGPAFWPPARTFVSLKLFSHEPRASVGKRVAAIAFPEKKESAGNLDLVDPSEEEENYFEPIKSEEMGTQVLNTPQFPLLYNFIAFDIFCLVPPFV